MRPIHPPAARLSLVLLLAGLLLAAPALQAGALESTPAAVPAEPAQPPDQPATGPGGAEVAYDGLLAQHYGSQPDGTATPTGYWLFEPTLPRAQGAAGPLPLVLFLHGFDVPSPEWYHAWIDHLVRRGAIVLYPDYQANNLPFDETTLLATDQSAPMAIQAAVTAALTELAGGSHAKPDPGRVVVVGHSLGALLGADYAGRAATGMPVATALLLVMPGCPATCDVTHLAAIPTTTRVVSVVGNQDVLAGEVTAKQIWAELGQIPADHKDYVRLLGDDHGQPALVADHFVPVTTAILFAGIAAGGLNAFDWYGTWKWGDALMSCRFAQQDCQDATGNTPEQRFLGAWSDGTPVTEAQVVTDPGPPTS
jgi:acetyl esterase/lipase